MAYKMLWLAVHCLCHLRDCRKMNKISILLLVVCIVGSLTEWAACSEAVEEEQQQQLPAAGEGSESDKWKLAAMGRKKRASTSSWTMKEKESEAARKRRWVHYSIRESIAESYTIL